MGPGRTQRVKAAGGDKRIQHRFLVADIKVAMSGPVCRCGPEFTGAPQAVAISIKGGIKDATRGKP